MTDNKEFFGARGKVFLNFEGTLHELAEKLQKDIEICDLSYDTDMDPPYKEFAMGGGLGLDCWIFEVENTGKYNFEFLISTAESGDGESIQGRMHDISSWLSKLLNIYNYETFLDVKKL